MSVELPSTLFDEESDDCCAPVQEFGDSTENNSPAPIIVAESHGSPRVQYDLQRPPLYHGSLLERFNSLPREAPRSNSIERLAPVSRSSLSLHSRTARSLSRTPQAAVPRRVRTPLSTSQASNKEAASTHFSPQHRIDRPCRRILQRIAGPILLDVEEVEIAETVEDIERVEAADPSEIPEILSPPVGGPSEQSIEQSPAHPFWRSSSLQHSMNASIGDVDHSSISTGAAELWHGTNASMQSVYPANPAGGVPAWWPPNVPVPVVASVSMSAGHLLRPAAAHDTWFSSLSSLTPLRSRTNLDTSSAQAHSSSPKKNVSAFLPHSTARRCGWTVSPERYPLQRSTPQVPPQVNLFRPGILSSDHSRELSALAANLHALSSAAAALETFESTMSPPPNTNTVTPNTIAGTTIVGTGVIPASVASSAEFVGSELAKLPPNLRTQTPLQDVDTLCTPRLSPTMEEISPASVPSQMSPRTRSVHFPLDLCDQDGPNDRNSRSTCSPCPSSDDSDFALPEIPCSGHADMSPGLTVSHVSSPSNSPTSSDFDTSEATSDGSSGDGTLNDQHSAARNEFARPLPHGRPPFEMFVRIVEPPEVEPPALQESAKHFDVGAASSYASFFAAIWRTCSQSQFLTSCFLILACWLLSHILSPSSAPPKPSTQSNGIPNIMPLLSPRPGPTTVTSDYQSSYSVVFAILCGAAIGLLYDRRILNELQVHVHRLSARLRFGAAHRDGADAPLQADCPSPHHPDPGESEASLFGTWNAHSPKSPMLPLPRHLMPNQPAVFDWSSYVTVPARRFLNDSIHGNGSMASSPSRGDIAVQVLGDKSLCDTFVRPEPPKTGQSVGISTALAFSSFGRMVEETVIDAEPLSHSLNPAKHESDAPKQDEPMPMSPKLSSLFSDLRRPSPKSVEGCKHFAEVSSPSSQPVQLCDVVMPPPHLLDSINVAGVEPLKECLIIPEISFLSKQSDHNSCGDISDDHDQNEQNEPIPGDASPSSVSSSDAGIIVPAEDAALIERSTYSFSGNPCAMSHGIRAECHHALAKPPSGDKPFDSELVGVYCASCNIALKDGQPCPTCRYVGAPQKECGMCGAPIGNSCICRQCGTASRNITKSLCRHFYSNEKQIDWID